MLLKMFDVLSVMLVIFAGPYRIIAYKFRTFGGVLKGLLTWAGIIIACPVFIALWPPDVAHETNVPYYWLALVLMAWVHMFAKWCSSSASRDPLLAHAWAGRGEPAFVVATCALVYWACGGGAASFLLVGYLCSWIQLHLTPLRRRLKTWTPADTARLWSPIRAVVPYLNGGVSRVCRFLLASSRFALRKAVLMIPVWGLVITVMGRWFCKPNPEFVTADGQKVYVPPRQSTFMGRVASHLVSYVIISAVTGTVLVKVFAFVLAIPLVILGGKATLPQDLQDKTHSFVSRMEDSFEEKKDAAVEKFRQKKEEITERFEEKKDEISEGIGRKKRQWIWNSLFD